MLCAISGEAPQEPVANRNNGTVYERRLIESYISSNATDPVDGSPLSTTDLIPLKTARAVKPRPPALTSIPALLSTFQNEWDALALETFTLKQQLAQLRQELSTALYQNDAAVRVIARVTRERDEARDALGSVSLQERRNGANEVNGGGEDAMIVDEKGLPSDAAELVEATKQRLSKTRRKRPVPAGWVTVDAVQAFEAGQASLHVSAPGQALALDHAKSIALIGGGQGLAAILSLESQQKLQDLPTEGGEIEDVLIQESSGMLIATSSGSVFVKQDNGQMHTLKTHSGPATALALHPSGEIFASVGSQDKTISIVRGQTEISRIITNSALTCCAFHPDGHLLAAGTTDSQVKVFDVKSSTLAATFELEGLPMSIDFSENGFWLAVAMADRSMVSIWDLRKAEEIKSLDFGGRINKVKFDYTGQYLAGAGPDGVAVQYYDKSGKTWSEVLRKAVKAVAVEWGAHAKSLVALTTDGALVVLQ